MMDNNGWCPDCLSPLDESNDLVFCNRSFICDYEYTNKDKPPLTELQMLKRTLSEKEQRIAMAKQTILDLDAVITSLSDGISELEHE